MYSCQLEVIQNSAKITQIAADVEILKKIAVLFECEASKVKDLTKQEYIVSLTN